MKISGEESAEAIRSWAREEVAKGPIVRYELGRFLFGVSSASGAAIVGLERLTSSPALDSWLGTSLLLTLLSALAALRLAIPQVISLDKSHDLFDLHTQQVNRTQKLALCWFSAWLVSLALGGKAVL